MIDLTRLSDLYSFEVELHSEKGFIDATIFIENWGKLSYEQKIIHRREWLKIDFNYSHETDAEKLRNNYEESVILVSELIIEFLNAYTIEYGNVKTDYLARIYTMLFCELESISRYTAYRHIIHIPYIVFEHLIIHAQKSELYREYKLDTLFSEYRRMLDLLDKNPYG